MRLFWKKKKIKKKDNKYNYQNIIEDILYFIPNSNIVRPKIINDNDTIRLIKKSNFSLCRFGDGELELIMGNDIPYQKYDFELSKKLKEILLNNQENLLVGICYFYFYPIFDTKQNQTQKDFILNSVPYHRKQLLSYIDFNKQYCAAEFTGIKNPNDKLTGNAFNMLRSVWANKNIVIVGCEEAKEKIQYDIFDNAKNINYIFCKNKNSWDDYDYIMEQCKKFSNDTIIILLSGPSGKVIASDLTKLNYRALDLGHIAKSYDFYKRKIEPTVESVVDFFKPDCSGENE